jgi:hypothetical protein
MTCASKAKAINPNTGKLNPGYKWARVSCAVKASSAPSRSSSARCKNGIVKNGKNRGKCRTRPLSGAARAAAQGQRVGFMRRGRGDAGVAAGRSYNEGAARFARGGSSPRSDIRAGASYNEGAARFARNMSSSRRGRNSRGQFTRG